MLIGQFHKGLWECPNSFLFGNFVISVLKDAGKREAKEIPRDKGQFSDSDAKRPHLPAGQHEVQGPRRAAASKIQSPDSNTRKPQLLAGLQEPQGPRRAPVSKIRSPDSNTRKPQLLAGLQEPQGPRRAVVGKIQSPNSSAKKSHLPAGQQEVQGPQKVAMRKTRSFEKSPPPAGKQEVQGVYRSESSRELPSRADNESEYGDVCYVHSNKPQVAQSRVLTLVLACGTVWLLALLIILTRHRWSVPSKWVIGTSPWFLWCLQGVNYRWSVPSKWVVGTSPWFLWCLQGVNYYRKAWRGNNEGVLYVVWAHLFYNEVIMINSWLY